MKIAFPRKLSNATGTILLVCFAVINALLVVQNLHLRKQLSGPRRLVPGDTVVPFAASGPSGESLFVGYSGEGKTHVLLFASADCRYCKEQAPYWRELVLNVDPTRFEVLLLVSQREDPKGLADYLAISGLDNVIVGVVSDEVLGQYKVSVTPTTLVVRDSGVVEAVWVGRWTPEMVAVASEILEVSFST